jgi:hypothetical protein
MKFPQQRLYHLCILFFKLCFLLQKALNEFKWNLLQALLCNIWNTNAMPHTTVNYTITLSTFLWFSKECLLSVPLKYAHFIYIYHEVFRKTAHYMKKTWHKFSYSRICRSHGCEYEDYYLLGCSAMYSGTSLPTFQRYLLPPSSQQQEAARTCGTSANFYQTTWSYNLEDSHLQ